MKRTGTVGFIIEEKRILLALIKYSKDKILWNGIGGYANEGEAPEDALIREVTEETYIKIDKNHLHKVKEIEGHMNLIVYKIDKWEGEMKAKDPSILSLKWFRFDDIPFTQMHEGNETWLPEVLKNNR